MLLLLAACAPGTVSVDGAAPADTGDDVERLDGDDTDVEVLPDTRSDDTSAPDTDADTDDDDLAALPKGCAAIYDPDELQTIELTFPGDGWEAIRRDCRDGAQTYRPLTLTWNGETVDAMARLKGNWSWSCDKLQFVISFNEEVPDARFHGLRKLMLDAPWYDHSLLHERLAFSLFEDRGLPYSCANNARLVVNGSYYGVYANVERIDREYLERHFEDPDGNLYQGGSELKTNEDVGDTSDLVALQAAVTVDEIAALMDLDQAAAEWAMEAMVPALDNYWAGVEINYYLYHDPTSGFVFLPYDLDISFGDSAYPSGGGLIWPEARTADPLTYEHYGWRKETLVKTVLSDPYWCDRFVEELEEARAVYDPDVLTARLDAWSAQIADAVADDTRRHWSDAEHATALASLRTFFVDRAAFVDAWLATERCPARF